MHNKQDFVLGVLGCLTGLLLFLVIIPHTIGVANKAGWLAHPLFSKADFAPKLWTALLLISSVFILIGSFKKPGPKGNTTEKKFEKSAFLSMLVLLGIMICFYCLFYVIGFLADSILCLLCAMWWFGYRNIVKSGLISVICSVIVYFVFTKLMYVPLP